MTEPHMPDFVLYDLAELDYKAEIVPPLCLNCVTNLPKRAYVTRKRQAFFLCEQCATKLYYIRKEKHNGRK